MSDIPRPAEHFVHGAGRETFVLVSGQTAAFLNGQGLGRVRTNARGVVDPVIYRDLCAISIAGMTWANAVNGGPERRSGDSGEGLALTVPEAATVLRMSPRGVRDAIRRGDLRAAKRGRQWLIDRNDIKKFKKATRRAA